MNANIQSSHHALPGRPLVGTLAIVFIVGLVVIDTVQSAPINPFAAPPPVALGSGEAPTGAHCTQP
ncbi:MAG: hypothetical protein Q8L60_04720 [Gammaproteobacteria bacterium]|nr:hypothetical protein [Gammaproteobacteria bacterium]MDP2140701.1 hypothetical protein [Gammaproteobacteria bacterium]MDP2346957.1 hypothetical protein [Gammaproteobacteria bacterium]